MARLTATRITVLALVALLAGVSPVAARQGHPIVPSAPSPASAGQPPVSAPRPVDPAVQSTPQIPVAISAAELERIQRALSQPTPLKLDDAQLRFYLEIVARQPTFADYVKGYDFINGPTKRGSPMTHQEFLNMVNPKELYSSAGITAPEMLQFALTNYLGQTLIRKALEDLKNARTEREVQEIRERIDRELEALRGGAGK